MVCWSASSDCQSDREGCHLHQKLLTKLKGDHPIIWHLVGLPIVTANNSLQPIIGALPFSSPCPLTIQDPSDLHQNTSFATPSTEDAFTQPCLQLHSSRSIRFKITTTSTMLSIVWIIHSIPSFAHFNQLIALHITPVSFELAQLGGLRACSVFTRANATVSQQSL